MIKRTFSGISDFSEICFVLASGLLLLVIVLEIIFDFPNVAGEAVFPLAITVMLGVILARLHLRTAHVVGFLISVFVLVTAIIGYFVPNAVIPTLGFDKDAWMLVAVDAVFYALAYFFW